MIENPSPGAIAVLVSQARLRDICHQLRRSGAFIALTDSFLAWLVGREGGFLLWAAALWWCTSIGVPLYRRRLARRYAALEGDAVRPALRHMERLSGAVGLIRGAIVVLAFATGNQHTQFLVTLLIIGLAAGAMATSGGSRRALMYWGVPVFAALTSCWLSRGTWSDAMMAVLMVFMFLIVVGYVRAFGSQQARMIATSEELRVERDRVQSVNRSITLLADKLREERDRASAANETKTRFLATASHDLRQPLYALGLHSIALEDIAGTVDNRRLARVSEGIRRSLDQAGQLLDALLDVSKLEAHAVAVHFDALELRSFTAGLLAQYETQAAEKGLTLVRPPAGPPVWIRSDETQLRRLLGNLLHNAVKFTEKGHVGMRLSDKQGHAVAEVFDSGPGIPEEERGRVFDEFYQIGNPARERAQGLGLGLSIVRLLAPLLEAGVDIRTEPGGGCCFSVSIPRAEAPTSEAPPAPKLVPAAAAPGEAKRRVLVIDDEPEILDGVAAMLSGRGWEVTTAQSSEEALECVDASAPPQILLVDYRLRTETGLEAIRAVQDRLGTRLPALIVTGDTAPQRIIETADAGHPVLHKSTKADVVEDTLARLLAAEGDSALTARQ